MLKDFLIKNNIDYKKVIELYLFIEDTNSDILDFDNEHEWYEAYPEYILDDLYKAEEKLEKYKILYEKEYPESNFFSEVYEMYCDELEEQNKKFTTEGNYEDALKFWSKGCDYKK